MQTTPRRRVTGFTVLGAAVALAVGLGLAPALAAPARASTATPATSVAAATATTATTATTVPTTVTVAYGSLPDQTAVVTYDKGAKGRPWVVLVHGGSWQRGSKADMAAAAALLHTDGFVVMTIDYRLSGTAIWPAPMKDAVTAVKWLKNRASSFGIDPHRGAFFGFSAGGHIAVTTALTYPGLVRGVVSNAGVLQPQRTFTSPYLTPANVVAEFGCAYTTADTSCGRRWKTALPQLVSDAADPPVYMLHGSLDNVVPPATLTAMAKILPNDTAVMVPGANHANALLPDGGTRWTAMLTWLRTATT